MIEPIMYFGIGFLVAALVGLVVIPLVHGRAVRLTMRRLEAATPLSMAEIQADKDQLRAEFAMSTRRLEVSVENLRTKSTSQLAELGKKGDAINRLKIELGARLAPLGGRLCAPPVHVCLSVGVFVRARAGCAVQCSSCRFSAPMTAHQPSGKLRRRDRVAFSFSDYRHITQPAQVIHAVALCW